MGVYEHKWRNLVCIMNIIEIRTQDVLNSLKSLNFPKFDDIEENYRLLLKAKRLYEQKQTHTYEQYLKKLIRIFLHDYESEESNLTLNVAFYYLRFFSDETEFLNWMSRHEIGRASLIFYEKLVLFYEKRGKFQKAIEAIEEAYGQGFTSKVLVSCRRRCLEKLKQSLTESNSNDEEKRPKYEEFYDEQYEELRWYYTFQQSFYYELEKKPINPYYELATAQYLISEVVEFLSPLFLFDVYYSYNGELNIVKPLKFSNFEEVKVEYIEKSENLINEQSFEVGSHTVEILQKLGDGGFGKVSVAQICDEKFAFKLFTRDKDSLLLENAASASFVREAYALAKMCQLNFDTYKMVCAVISDQGAGILMQLAQGPSLYKIMRENLKLIKQNEPCFSEDDIVRYFKKMLRDVTFLFRNDFVHADLKIDNWLLGDNNNVVLIDFGKAIDLKLFRRTKCLYFGQNTLNPVSPAPSCSQGWCFEADLIGLGSCLFSLIQGRIMSKEDIEKNQVEMKACKSMKRGSLWQLILNKLMFTRCDADSYEKEKQKAVGLLEDIDKIL